MSRFVVVAEVKEWVPSRFDGRPPLTNPKAPRMATWGIAVRWMPN